MKHLKSIKESIQRSILRWIELILSVASFALSLYSLLRW